MTYQRTGTLWEGRHKSSVVDAENYLLVCYRYIELNPVRAGMVKHPAEYLWSSYRVNAGIRVRKGLAAHDVYVRLGSDKPQRREAYRNLFVDELGDAIHDIRHALNFSMPTGNHRFQQQIETALGRQLGHARRGRPKNINANE